VLIICGAWMIVGGAHRRLPRTRRALRRRARLLAGLRLGVGGLLLNAALITTIGFILSCALCYLLAVQGLRRASGPAGRQRAAHLDHRPDRRLISAPVFWMFTKFLAINLPGLTATGWI
jgi:putative tricarboxylic transport membrane protein